MQAEASDRLLTIPEAAAWLRISERYLSKLAKRGDVPRIKMGTATRYDRRDLVEYVERCKQRPK